MKTFTTTDTSAHDLVHMVGSKDDYTITENGGAISYVSDSWQRTYVVSGNEELNFKRPDSQGKTKFKWNDEFTPFNVKSSCKAWLDSGATTDGIYKIKPADIEFDAYCDMTTDGGGWTMIVAQFESDPVTNWNEGIQSDYDPSLNTSKGFALNSSEIPTHTQTAFGKHLDPTYIDYVNFNYTTGNIPTTNLSGQKGNYGINRDSQGCYNSHDTESGWNPNIVDQGWHQTLTFDKHGGTLYSWSFSPHHQTPSQRGYGMNGSTGNIDNSYAWTVWVR